MKKATTIRRIIGITALVLWAVTIASVFLDEGVRIAYQLDGWAFGIALILTPVYAVMLTIHFGRGKHWLIKVAAWIVCAIVIYVCGMLLYFSTILPSDHRAWSNKDYVVYAESNGWIDPDDLVLYRRAGLIDRKMYRLRCEDWLPNDKVEYAMIDSLDLVIEEYSAFCGDSIYYHTIFYRLSNGKRYDKSQNDSLLALIEK